MGHASADASRILQPAVIVMEAQQEEAQKRVGPFRVRPADEAFEAVSSLAVATLMIAEFDPVGRFRKERSQAALSLAERKGHQIVAFDLEEVEGEIDQTGAPRSEACCIAECSEGALAVGALVVLRFP